MASAVLATLTSLVAFAFVEGLGHFYPAKRTWLRLRRARGRLSVRLMRERFEDAADKKTPRALALALVALIIVWIATSSLLDKRWYEVAVDAAPYVFVGLALLRTPPAMKAIAERMKEYEREAGEDPDAPLVEENGGGDGGPSAIAL